MGGGAYHPHYFIRHCSQIFKKYLKQKNFRSEERTFQNKNFPSEKQKNLKFQSEEYSKPEEDSIRKTKEDSIRGTFKNGRKTRNAINRKVEKDSNVTNSQTVETYTSCQRYWRVAA